MLTAELVRPESPTLARQMLKMIFKFAGEPVADEAIDAILKEAQSSPAGG